MTRLQDVYDKKQIPVFVMRQKRPPVAGLLALDNTICPRRIRVVGQFEFS
jgi:hypothetical protein